MDCQIKCISVVTFVLYQIISLSVCAEIVIYSNDLFVHILPAPKFDSSRFYDCLGSNYYRSCVLNLQSVNEKYFNATGVSEFNGTNESNSSTFRCVFSTNSVNCTRMSSDCLPNVKNCGSGQFKIQWNFVTECLDDKVLTNCSNISTSCAVYTIARTDAANNTTTTLSSTSGDISRTLENSPSTYYLNTTLQNTLYNWDSTTISTYSYTLNNNSVTLINHTNNTNFISINNIPSSILSQSHLVIILVVAYVSIAFSSAIMVYCIWKKRKIKKESNNSVMFLNENSDDRENNIGKTTVSTTEYIDVLDPLDNENLNNKHLHIYNEYNNMAFDNGETSLNTQALATDSPAYDNIQKDSVQINGSVPIHGDYINEMFNASMNREYDKLGNAYKHDYIDLNVNGLNNARQTIELAQANGDDTGTNSKAPLNKAYDRLGNEYEHEYTVLKSDFNTVHISDNPDTAYLTLVQESVSHNL